MKLGYQFLIYIFAILDSQDEAQLIFTKPRTMHIQTMREVCDALQTLLRTFPSLQLNPLDFAIILILEYLLSL